VENVRLFQSKSARLAVHPAVCPATQVSESLESRGPTTRVEREARGVRCPSVQDFPEPWRALDTSPVSRVPGTRKEKGRCARDTNPRRLSADRSRRLVVRERPGRAGLRSCRRRPQRARRPRGAQVEENGRATFSSARQTAQRGTRRRRALDDAKYGRAKRAPGRGRYVQRPCRS